MKKITALVLTLAMSATAALAGGPIVVVEEPQPEVVAELPRSGALLPLLLLGVAVALVVTSGDDDEENPS